MSNIAEKLSKLKTNLNDLAYEIGQGVDRKVLHNKTLAILIGINEIEQFSEVKAKNESPDHLKEQEIKKVERKLKLWARNPSQVNSQILNKYLKLSSRDDSPISREYLGNIITKNGINNFTSNFHAMSHIGPKNHAKVFEVKDGIVSIWEPVKKFVDEYYKNRPTPPEPKIRVL